MNTFNWQGGSGRWFEFENIQGKRCDQTMTISAKTADLPPEAIEIELSSSDEAVIAVPQRMIIPAGSRWFDTELIVHGPGSATITASGPNLVPFTSEPIVVEIP